MGALDVESVCLQKVLLEPITSSSPLNIHKISLSILFPLIFIFIRMPCTQHEDQEQHSRRASFRSTFSRTFAGLRFSEQQNLQSFSISSPHHNHSAISPSSDSSSVVINPEDLTEQIRISVQDTHISQRSFSNDLGGNISDVLDSYEDNAQQHQQSQSSLSNQAEFLSASIVISNIPQSTNHQLPSSSSRSVDHHQASNNQINLSLSRRFVVSNNEFIQLKQDNQVSKSTTNLQENQARLAISESNDDETFDTSSPYPSGSSNQLDQQILPPRISTVSENTTNKKFQDTESTPASSDNGSESDTLTISGMIPQYISHRQAGVIKNYLYDGSSFSGFQKSKNESYEVNVKIQHVDYENSYLCGYLCINHLTKTHPSLTTFFEGEIISKQYPFLTRKWEATEEIDRAHWSKFDGFGKKYSRTFNLDTFDYDELKKSDFIYMRWKEHFLVPDHTIKHVEGASYAGFYYICYSKRTSCIRGYYFHINSEQFER